MALVAAFGAAILGASPGPPPWEAIRALRGLAIVLGLVVLFYVVTDDWQIGLAAALRLATLTSLGVMLTLSTRFDDLLAVVEALLRPLRRLGVGPSGWH